MNLPQTTNTGNSGGGINSLNYSKSQINLGL
jgi:hypothetical protein